MKMKDVFYDITAHDGPCTSAEPEVSLRLGKIEAMLEMLMNLDKLNVPEITPVGEPDMAYKINRAVVINGNKTWIHANSEQEYVNKVLALTATPAPVNTTKHNFAEYAWNWYTVFTLPTVEIATATTYKRQLDLHILPRIGSMAIEDVTVADLQGIFNAVGGTKSTKDKVKQVLHSIFEHAVEDGLVPKNLTKSKNLKITGAASTPTTPYTVEQMRYLAANLNKIPSESDRAYLILQMFHPLRLEEVLGLKWGDIDHNHGLLHIRRAVTHPTRNQPIIKETKTEASVRTLGLSGLVPHRPAYASPDDFVIGGKTPYSYTQVRRMCERIQRETGFAEKVTPIRFRTTTLTDLYESTKDIKQVQAAAGHTTAAMTLKHYVTGRSSLAETAAIIEQTYLPQ